MYIFTIIIPHYNIPSLLKRCLDSIPPIDYVQVIVVDDNSNEYNKSLLKDMELTYPHFYFIYQEKNGGGGSARNIGLKHAKGQYVLFADADDFFNDCLQKVLEDYKDKSYDQIFFKANSVECNSFIPANRANHLNQYIDSYISGEDSRGDHLRFLFGEPWARIIKLSMLEQHHIRFEETPIHNDTAFGYLTGYYAKSIHADERMLYCVTVRENSVSLKLDRTRILTRMEVFGRAEKFLTIHHIKVFPHLHFWQLTVLLVNNKFSIAKECIGILRNMGYSYSHIASGIFFATTKIIKDKFKL